MGPHSGPVSPHGPSTNTQAAPIGLMSVTCAHEVYLPALLGGLDVDLGPLLEGLPQHVPDQGLAGDLHGHHVPGAFQDRLGSTELTGPP